MPLAGGDTFAGYTIVALLGVGGMGEVYLAEHPRLPRRDALKVLPGEISSNPEFRARFRREAGVAATLWHPHIVRVHDSGEFDDKLWLSMDYVDGTDVGQLLKHHPTGMPVDDALDIVGAVAGALDYAHKGGLLHRDVKPANILVGADESGEQRILLTDFGIARRMDDTSSLTGTNMTVGTLAYSAPEQLLGNPLDGRADQYALAATAHMLLSGTTVFPSSTPAALINSHVNVVPLRLSVRRPELGRFDRALARALEKNPAARFPTCLDFAEALRGAPRPQWSPQPSPAPQPPWTAPPQWQAAPPTPAPAQATNGRWIPYVVGGLALVLALLVIVVVMQMTSHDDTTTAGDTTAAGSRVTTSERETTATTTTSTPTATTTEQVITVPGADAYGFLDYPDARCRADDRAAAIARTTLSVLVVCDSPSAGYYYRGVRLSDLASIEINQVTSTATGFDVVNPADGTRYEIRPDRLSIISGTDVYTEPMVNFEKIS